MNNPIVVTGYGPRSGTSAVMRWLKEEGYLVHGTQYTCPLPDGSLMALPEETNEGGYYECPVCDLSMMRGMGGFTKIWPGRLAAQRTLMKPRAIIALKRTDRFAQIRSVEDQMNREILMNLDTKIHEVYSDTVPQPYEVIANDIDELCDYLKWYEGPVLRVQTEDLDYQLNTRIKEFIKEVIDEEC